MGFDWLHAQPMFRELRMAYAGFQLERVDRPNFAALATGNWGCGVFGGFVELKFILQASLLLVWMHYTDCHL